MTQTRRGSLAEAGANIVFGYAINVVANMFILKPMGFAALTWKTNLVIGLMYTVVSVARQFAFRRIFNSIKASWNYVHHTPNR